MGDWAGRRERCMEESRGRGKSGVASREVASVSTGKKGVIPLGPHLEEVLSIIWKPVFFLQTPSNPKHHRRPDI